MLNITEQGNENNLTLVMLHGLGGTSRYWNTGIDGLIDEYHVMRIDLLGFGDSPKPWQNYTEKKHLFAIENALKKYDSFVLVGHSLGAALALLYAQNNPTKVASLILISLPIFKDQPGAYRWMRRTPSGWLMTNMTVAALTCMTTRRIAKRILPHFLKKFPREIIEDLVKHNVMSSITTLWNVLYNQSFLQHIDLLSPNLTVYCIHAKNDATAPYKNVEELVSLLPQWRLTALERSDHHPWLWDNQICLEILNKVI